MKNYLFMLITQQVSSVPASTTLFQDVELISESLGWVEGDAADADPVPMAPGIPHPAQVPASACSSQHLPGAAPTLLSPGLFIPVQTRLGLESFGCRRGQKWGWDVPADFLFLVC